MKTSLLASLLMGLTGLFAITAAYAGPTLDAVKARDKVICSATGDRIGFSLVNSKGVWEGLDADTCRAVAAAVLGDSNKVKFVKTTIQTRLTTLQTGEVDLTVAHVTRTLARDASLGLDFAPTTFYDAQGFMVNRNSGVKSVKDLDGATICVKPGSTSQQVVNDVAHRYNLHFKLIVIANQQQVNTAFFSGRCDVQVLSTAGLASNRALAAPNPEDWIILPEVFGKDPEGPVVRQGDAQWNDIVDWTVYAMIRAEELGVTSKNVDKMLKSDNPVIQRLLGVKGDLGQDLGLDNQWAYRIIKQVGNYGEVFDRSLGKDSPLKLDRGLNALGTQGGLMYAPAFK